MLRRRSESRRLIDVPISISVVGSETIERAGVQSISDLSYLVPNLSVVESSSSTQVITIRGVGNTIGESPLVGIYLDEIPTSIVAGLKVDLQTNDLDRVEVLKGPQGSIYGQGSVGGTIRFIANRPSLDSFDGEVSFSVLDTSGGGLSKGVSAVANIPLVEDTLAVRISTEYKDRAGWIDQPATNKKDVNDSELENTRIKALWRVNDSLNVDMTAVMYRNDSGADNTTNIGFVEESNYQVVDVDGLDLSSTGIKNEYDLFNFNIVYDFDFGTLVSSSSYFDAKNEKSSFSVFEVFPSFDLLSTDDNQHIKGFTQEIRLSGVGDSLDWVVGGFYTDIEDSISSGGGGFIVSGINALPLPASGSLRKNESIAVFGNVSYEVNEQVTLSVGTRYFEDDRTSKTLSESLQSETFDNLSSNASISYAVNDTTNIYLSVSEGFRSGGFNSGDAESYDPESVVSYELGAKALLFGGRVSADGALFHSKYSDYQGSSIDNQGRNITLNPGEAEIEGCRDFCAI